MSDLCEGCAEYQSRCTCDTPQPQSGFWFTVDSLAAALHAKCEAEAREWDRANPGIDQSLHMFDAHRERAAAIIQAAKEANE